MNATKSTLAPVHVRWMIRRDLAEVLSIEHASFEFPWSESDFLQALRQRNCIGMVAVHQHRVTGFMVYELWKDRITLLNLAVDPRFCRLGIGTRLVEKLVGKITGHRRNRICVLVRERNLPAQLFFRSQRFLAVRTMRGFFEEFGREDGIEMERRAQAGEVAVTRG